METWVLDNEEEVKIAGLKSRTTPNIWWMKLMNKKIDNFLLPQTAKEIAKLYGTPCYVYDLTSLEH